MATIEIKIKGLARVRAKLAKLIAMDANIITPELKEWGKDEADRLQNTAYPPPRPQQRYKRTGKLGRSWSSSVIGSAAVKISNNAGYAPWVVGEKQAWMHAGRWWQARPIVEKDIPELTKSITKKIDSPWNGA